MRSAGFLLQKCTGNRIDRAHDGNVITLRQILDGALTDLKFTARTKKSFALRLHSTRATEK